MRQTPRFEKLIEAVAPRSRLVRAWALAGGISAGMTAVEIEASDGARQRMIVRKPSAATLARNLQAASNEFTVLRAARAAGLAVPRALALDAAGAFGLGPCLVIEFVEGAVEFAPADPDTFIAQFAQQLALIHRVDASRPEWSLLPPARLAGELAAGPEREMALETQHVRAALVAAGPPRRPGRPSTPALLHGDYWPGNVLWRSGQLAAVVDWEDAAVGDPLADLAISRLDVLCLFGTEAMARFTQHYQAGRARDETALPYWDLCAALRLARLVGADLAGWAAFFAPLGRADITEATLRERYDYFVKQAIAHHRPELKARG